MSNLKVIKTNILNPISPYQSDYQTNIFLEIQDEKIKAISKDFAGSFIDKTDLICIPGFIDTHVHLSQFKIKGSHSPNLLHWLSTYTFKEENRSRNPQYAENIARMFFQDLLKQGTTTSVIYTAPFLTACDRAFKVAEEMNVRTIIGMTMMDQNSPDYLQQETNNSLRDSFYLYDKWHQHSPRLEYGLAPRFAPTCSRKLMLETGKFARENNVYIQTHLSENHDEIAWVKELFPECKTYTEVYHKFDILGPKTLLGHVIHINDFELSLIKDTKSKVIHCPDSNFFLKSGMFPYERIIEAGIDIGLATDVAGGTSLSMLNIMKMFAYRQNSYLVSPNEAFYFATLGGAVALSKTDIIGSITVGKQADLVFLDIPESSQKDKDNLLSDLLYLGQDIKTESVFIAGDKVYEG